MYLGIHRKDPARAPIVLRRALILGLVMSLLTAGMALADNVQNDITREEMTPSQWADRPPSAIGSSPIAATDNPDVTPATAALPS